MSVGMILWLTPVARSEEPDVQKKSPREFAEMSLEQLSNIEVTSVSKKTEKLSEAPAAVTVITQEDIRRSGATSIPEALRLAPGLDVGEIDAHSWAISARGFNDQYANKLLVMMDGRTLYTPLFSGVFWDQQDTLLEDVDRIEVVRGPGATQWGANAVDGVINIITKSAKDTQGTLLTGGGGTQELGYGGVRYGDKLAPDLYYRVYAKYFDRDNSVLPSGVNANDAWQAGQTGFRMDWDPGHENLATFQGDYYQGRINQTFTVPTFTPPYQQTVPNEGRIEGGNILGRYTHTFAENSDISLQMYYDRYLRDVAVFRDDQQTIDLDFQHRIPVGQRQDVLWGLGYRLMADDVRNSPSVALSPTSRSLQLFSGFVQDEIRFAQDHLRFTLGSKFEHNDFTGMEIQPTARLSWLPQERHTLWASVSRAVRTPSIAEENVTLNQVVLPPGTGGSPLPIQESLRGDAGFISEEEIAYELGYRVQPLEQVSFDVAAFYNDYQHLRSVEPGAPVANFGAVPPYLTMPFFAANKLRGDTYGVEVAANWQVVKWWRLRASYTYLEMNLSKSPDSLDTFSLADAGKSPQHQFMIRSSMDLPAHLELDSTARYVDRLPTLGVSGYAALDARLGWRHKNLEISIVGQNLFHNRQLEFAPTFIGTQTIPIEQSVFGKITWHF